MSLLTFTDRKRRVKRNEIMSSGQILLLSKLWYKINTAASALTLVRKSAIPAHAVVIKFQPPV